MDVRRYGEGTKYIEMAKGLLLGYPSVIERPDGEYVAWDDYKRLADQIENSQELTVHDVLEWLKNDSYAITHQSLAQYRAAIIKSIEECLHELNAMAPLTTKTNKGIENESS